MLYYFIKEINIYSLMMIGVKYYQEHQEWNQDYQKDFLHYQIENMMQKEMNGYIQDNQQEDIEELIYLRYIYLIIYL